MRTTIEIEDEIRAKLLKKAAQRGEKGYSRLVNEALKEYLEKDTSREEKLADIIKLRGCISEQQAKDWQERIEQSWKNWEL